MRKFLIRIMQVIALAMIGTGLLTYASLAETKRQAVKSMCDMAGGTFVVERDGKYSCIFPGGKDGAGGVQNCTKDGKCSVTNCYGKTCYTLTLGDRKPPKVTTQKREDGLTTMTAGTVQDRGGRVAGTPATNAALNGGVNTGAAAGIATSAPTGSATVASKVGTTKPATAPAQLTERLNRLQQQR